jgi:hypothetical protein
MKHEAFNRWFRRACSGEGFTVMLPDDEITLDDLIERGHMKCVDGCSAVREVSPSGVLAACPECGEPEVDLHDLAAAIEGMIRVEEYNDQFRQPNPNGRYPSCKPRLYDVEYCERCGSWIKGVDGACPAVLSEQRWGEDFVPLP